MENNSIKVGLIGVGSQGKKHLDSLVRLSRHGEINLVGVCDLKENSDLSSATYYKDYRELLKRKPEIVIIATPNYLHRQMTIDAMEMGIDVIKEKPFAISIKEAEEIKEIASANKRIVAVMQQRLFHPTFIKVKELIAEYGLPDNFFYQLSINDENYSWYWDRESGGGCWLNLGWHAIYLINWIVDEVDSLRVFSKKGNMRSFNYNVDHTSLAKILTRHGVQGSILVSSVMEKEEYLKLGYPGIRILLWNDTIYLISKGKKIKLAFNINKNDIYDKQMAHLIASVKNKTYDLENDLSLMQPLQEGLNQINGVNPLSYETF